jgi:hypothetical protein
MLTSDGCSAAGRPLRHVPLLHFRCAGALCLGTCATALGPALHGSPPDGVIAPSICRNQRGHQHRMFDVVIESVAVGDAIKGKPSCRLNDFGQICVCRAKPATHAGGEEGP